MHKLLVIIIYKEIDSELKNDHHVPYTKTLLMSVGKKGHSIQLNNLDKNGCTEFERELDFQNFESKFKITFYESNEEHTNFYEHKINLNHLKSKIEMKDIFIIDNKYIITYKLKLLESNQSGTVSEPVKTVKDIQSNTKQTEDVVTINVGGQLFTTRKSTLTRCNSSILNAIMSGKHTVSYDKDGNIFIDRDPKLFQYILDYLRDPNQLDIERMEASTRRKLYLELDYYCIDISSHKSLSNMYLNDFSIDIISKRQWRHSGILKYANEKFVYGCIDSCGLYSIDIVTGSILDHITDSLNIACFLVSHKYIYIYLSNKVLLIYSLSQKKLENRINLKAINTIVDMKYINDNTLIVIFDTSMCCVLYIESEGKIGTVDLINGARDKQIDVIENTNMAVIGCKNGSIIVMDYAENKIVTTLNLHRMGNTKVKTIKDYVLCFGMNFLKVFQHTGDNNFKSIITIKKKIYDACIQNNLLILYDHYNHLDFWDMTTKELIYSQNINLNIGDNPDINVNLVSSECGSKVFLVENSSCTIIKFGTTL